MDKKEKAHAAVATAVKNGILAKASQHICVDCGGRAFHWHHESYKKSNWLDVIPLCASCHSIRHMKKSGGDSRHVLTSDEVVEIRKMAKSGMGARQIVRYFNVGVGSIYEIIQRKSYKWVD